MTNPIELGRKSGIRSGTKLIMREVDDQIVVMTMESYVRSLRWKYKGMGLMTALIVERQHEREL